MTLKEWFQTQPRGAGVKLAAAVEVTPTWIALIAAGRRKASPRLAKAIEDATQGAVTRQELRPDLF